jgi:hypothetical protein
MLVDERFILLMLYLKIKNQKLNNNNIIYPKFSYNMKLKNFSFPKYKI